MREPHYSAGSARPMDEHAEDVVKNAGIPVRKTPCDRREYPAQEQAAARSMDQMAAVSPDGVSGDPGRCRRMENVSREMRTRPSKTDPSGSWTGVPDNPMESPVQDADDL